MTVIAVRDGCMAADSRGKTASDVPYQCEKLFRIRGMLVGVCGDDKGTNRLIAFFRGGERNPEQWDCVDGSALVLCPKRGLLHYDANARPDLVKEPFWAIGSGAPVALGAMERGATAIEAVEAACRWNTDCGLPVVSMNLRSIRNGLKAKDPR